jgi:hypothetical protein
MYRRRLSARHMDAGRMPAPERIAVDEELQRIPLFPLDVVLFPG